MKKITDKDIKYICECLKNWEKIPAQYKEALFWKEIEKKEYELKYSAKEREEDIIANTYASPLQKIKTYNPDGVIDHKDFIRWPETKEQFSGWYNKLIFWDNLQVLKELLQNEKLQEQIKENGWIKLIYIDPPFATKSDFVSGKGEKAYSDKISWAEFIEFIRKRLVLMKELLSSDGSIYVHLDWKKSHYIKVLMDEIFWEHNFINEITWHYSNSGLKARSKKFHQVTDTIYLYSKNRQKFIFNHIFKDRKDWQSKQAKRKFNSKTWKADMVRDENGKIVYQISTTILENALWETGSMSNSPERISYPTQKPETLLEKVIKASSQEWDIVLDAFAGSGTTLAVAEKLGRKWIGIDGGKLSIYTIQNRLMNLKEEIWNKGKDLKPKPFAVYNAGLYDFQILKNLDWNTYTWFTLSLFQCIQEEHKIDGIKFDGYLNLNHVQVFDYNHGRKGIVLDRGYIENIDEKIGNKLWKRIFIIAPATKIDGIFEDVVHLNWREYFLLRVPYSIIKELYTKEFEKIKQPTSEDDVNNTVEAVGFDFIRIPKVKVNYSLKWEKACIQLETFESKVISNKKLEYKNLETLSNVIIDYDYNGEYIKFEEVIFADKIKKNDYIIELDSKQLKTDCMIIYIDIFWNERKEIISLETFKN